MKRRLYFLLPDAEHSRVVFSELQAAGIERRFMHAIAGRGIDLQDLPIATQQQHADVAARIERYLWGGNLGVFFIALLALLVLAVLQVNGYWLLLPAGVMLAAFSAGLGFVRHIPNVHLAEFRDALQHREILLMIDVPVSQVARIEELVHRHHPEAIVGGVGWSVSALPV